GRSLRPGDRRQDRRPHRRRRRVHREAKGQLPRQMTVAVRPVGIVGAGAMGAGIAQVAASRGWPVYLLDVDEPTVAKAIADIRKKLDRLVEKGLLEAEKRDEAVQLLHAARAAADLKNCDLVIEAIIEDLSVKTAVLSNLVPHLPADSVIASNTS